ncbi:hypothetical protein [Erythrobacter sp. HL-111]|uniref:hypothetical protein n=1 Tax=Erythrobacter sp. HL-111 TaxID=1798193 RepID=UPI00087CE6A3|nr:hypothetical protein [Erythrobacter sp. HL-111]SDS48002.1 hypothetical protein SAMN04515621_1644 [Erythrobacter sp. HL-111]
MRKIVLAAALGPLALGLAACDRPDGTLPPEGEPDGALPADDADGGVPAEPGAEPIDEPEDPPEQDAPSEGADIHGGEDGRITAPPGSKLQPADPAS